MNFFQGVKRFFGLAGSAYEAAKKDPTRTAIAYVAPKDARAEISETERREIVRIGRSLEKNSGFFRELFLANSIYSVGDGMFPQPRSGNPEWNRKAREVFDELTRRPETSERFPFWKVQDLVCRLLDVDGEVFAVKTENENGLPKLQMLETHRLSSKTDPDKNIYDGIRYNSAGKPVSYYFRNAENDAVDTEIDAQFVIHCFIAGRFTDTRGISPAQHSFNDIRDARDLDAIEKATDKHINSFGLVLTSDEAARQMEYSPISAATEQTENPKDEKKAADTAPRPMTRIGGAQATILKEGESASLLESNRPSPAWLGLRNAIDNTAALGNIPLGFLSNPEALGGASVRLVVGKASRYFSRRQQEIISQFLDKVWEFFIGWAITHGKLENVPGWWKTEWTTPRKLSVDNGRDSAQIRADIEAGIIPIQDDFAARALDFDKESDARIALLKSLREKCAAAGIPPEEVYPILFKTLKESE